MHNDDRPIGHLLSRRRVMALFGAPAAAALAHRAAGGAGEEVSAQVAPDCVAQPRQTEGPYFVDERLQRSDIRPDPSTGAVRPGAPLDLRLVVSHVTESGVCAPLGGVQVDIWHCDAAGVYSDVADRRVNTVGQQFLRGYQISDAGGHVRFTTIYPGWYGGRAVHIHFKIRVPSADGLTDEFTSQFYFSDELTDRVHAQDPYAAHTGQRLVNARDRIFRDGGAQLMLAAVEAGDGYSATFTIAMRPGQR